jgi:uncharacterized membrane protein
MKLAENNRIQDNARHAAPLLLGMGLGALLMYMASAQRRQPLLPASTPLRTNLGDRATQLVSQGRREAMGYAQSHPAVVIGVLAGLASIGVATLAVRKSPTLRESLQHMASKDAIHVSKSVEISASPEQVFDVWSKVDNFPRFMSMVKEVQSLDGDRSHWKVKGPAGVPVEWNSVITERERGRVLAWQSEEGSMVEHGGRVELEPCTTGTRATVSMTYRPPGGRLGHVAASLFGRNPKQDLDRDLQRMKTFVEERSGLKEPTLATSTKQPSHLPVR